MKNEVINIRISSSFKEELEILSSLKGLSLSDLGRNALNEYYNTTPIEEGGVHCINERKHSEDEDKLLQSLAFTEFIFWIYHKKNNLFMDEIIPFYEQHLALIDEMHQHPRFDVQILNEFEKIRLELKEKVFGSKGDFNQFSFPKGSHSGSFNYELLADFMYTIRYTNREDKDLFIK